MFALCSFFFNDTATTEIYTLSLHDALPICAEQGDQHQHDRGQRGQPAGGLEGDGGLVAERAEVVHPRQAHRSEEHTSELQSRQYLVCRLLLEKKKNPSPSHHTTFIVHRQTA